MDVLLIALGMVLATAANLVRTFARCKPRRPADPAEACAPEGAFMPTQPLEEAQ